jgi:serine/threonine-protein kinase HipA
MNRKQLSIRLHGRPVGILEQTVTGKKEFTYHNDAVSSISVSMPIREEPYSEKHCEAFFGGLLPESIEARRLIGKKYGISPSNSFSLLGAIGYDCAGAISCHAVEEPIVLEKAVPISGMIITEKELLKHILALPTNPLFLGVKDLRLSLAGAQDKAAICLIDHQIAFPEKGCPTTHILKPAISHFEGIAENEYFIMKIAKRLGFGVPNVEIRKFQNITVLLIERYDRHTHENYIERVHQEDFCQALAIPSSMKYQNEEGPGFKQSFELLNHTYLPAVDRNRLASIVIFNYLIGNMDAHGKNFSLVHHSDGIKLSPFYDILCTRAYPELASKMAMKIGSQYDADDVQPRHWQQLCEDVNYRYLALASKIEIYADQIKRAAMEEKEQIQANSMFHPIIDKIIDVINLNIDQTLKKFNRLKQ